MGYFRFRRSIKIAPGIKLNFNKKSVGMTVGTKGAHYTINSKGQRTKSVGIPGTGLSYIERDKINSGKNNKNASKKSYENIHTEENFKVNKATKHASQTTGKKLAFKIFGIIFIAFGALCIISSFVPPISVGLLICSVFIVFCGIMLLKSISQKPSAQETATTPETNQDLNHYFDTSYSTNKFTPEQVEPIIQSPPRDENEVATLESASKQISTDAGKIYAQTIFLKWANGEKLNGQYPGYLKFEFGILDSARYHSSMISTNYLEKASATECLSTLKIDELRPILESFGLKKSGKKADLIKSVIENLTPEQLNEVTKDINVYVLSDKGKQYLEDHEDYIVLHDNRNWNISLDEYENAKQQMPFTGSAYDVAWSILDNRRLVGYTENSYRFISDTDSMGFILYEEEKYADAICQFCLASFHSMNSNLDYLEYRSDDTIEELRNSFHIYDINPDIMAKIYDKKDYYSHDNVASFISNWPITKTIITLPEYLSLIEASLETGTYSIEPYKDIMFKKYLKYCGK